MATQGRTCGSQPNKPAEHKPTPMHCVSACRRLQSQLPASKLELSTPNVTAVHAYAPPATRICRKLHYSMQGLVAEDEDDSACACMQGSHGPICKLFRADVSRFLDFTLRKVTCHFFRLFVLDFLDARLERLGVLRAAVAQPASSFVAPFRLGRSYDFVPSTCSEAWSICWPG
jgi:hypothetical protein